MFEKFCTLATVGIFDLANLIGEVRTIYKDEECEALLSKVEELREDHYLDAIFGMYSKMENEDWLKEVIK